MTDPALSEQCLKEQTQIQSAAFLSAICICVVLSVYFVLSHTSAAGDDEKIVLDGKINPNTDTAVSMARLPSLGEKKAQAVVEYRQNENRFEIADDLDKVKGIGPKTVENVRPYLKFE